MSPETATLLAPLIQAIIAAIVLVLTTLIGLYVPKAIAAFEARTGIQLTAQQIGQVTASANTAKGIVETMLDQGALKIEEIKPDSPIILAQAQAAVARVPVAAAALNKSVPSMAQTIVGLVDTSPKMPPSPVIVVPATTVPAPPA